MKRKVFSSIAFCLLAAFVFTSCNQKYPGYKRTSDGLYYRFYKHNTSEQQPNQTDFLKLDMACYLADSLYYDWSEMQSEVFVQLGEPHFKGDLQSALAMMRVGDSASFYIKADSIAIHYYEQNPDSVGLGPDDMLRYEVKLLEVQTQDEFKEGIERMRELNMQKSRETLATYVKENGIDVSPDESGIYIIPIEKGKGRCPEKGEKVELDFEASLLNGQQIGSTFGSDEKFSFVLGEGYVIPGWEKIVPKMHLGERVKAIIPCEMAYGEHSVQGIPSYANLVYDIKLLKITTVEEQQRQAELAVKKQRDDSEKAFWDYLIEHKIGNHTETGLYYDKFVMREGEVPQKGMTARITFDAKYLDGTPLGSSEQLGGHYDVVLGQGAVLRGLEEGIGLMRVGEKARFVLPYTLAYGEKPYGNIPAFSNLVFDVELLELLPATETVDNK